MYEEFKKIANSVISKSKRFYDFFEKQDVTQELVFHCFKKKDKYKSGKAKPYNFFLFITYVKLKELQRTEAKKRCIKQKNGEVVHYSEYAHENPLKEREDNVRRYLKGFDI
jgi:DNA-directed RNA polymerase specialized sigma24 family protein